MIRGLKPDDPAARAGRGVRGDEAKRLVRVHGDQRHEADGDGVDLREVPQLPRAVEAEGPLQRWLRVL